jgi:hypothetical protein
MRRAVRRRAAHSGRRWWLSRSIVLAAPFAMLAGCASQAVLIAPKLPPQAQRLGRAEGESCGVMPLNTSSRLETAYDRALASVPGAAALDDVTIDEQWFYAGMTIWCTKVTGEGVK